MWPLFLLLAIRGNGLVPDNVLLPSCAGLILIPMALLFARIRVAEHDRDRHPISIGSARDHRADILVYLFAILLPLYLQDLDDAREIAATIVALGVIVYVFWRLNLHYMNLLFLMMRYNSFAVHPPSDGNPHTDRPCA